MAGETSLLRRAFNAISEMGLLTPESRAVQADIAKQRMMRYKTFMEPVEGIKGTVNLAPDAAPVIRMADGRVMVLPKGANIPEGAQVLNKSRSEIDDIVYNRAKEYDPHTAGAIGAGAIAAPAALAYQTSTPEQSGRENEGVRDNGYMSPDGVSVYGNAQGPSEARQPMPQPEPSAPAPIPRYSMVGMPFPTQQAEPQQAPAQAPAQQPVSNAQRAVAAARQTVAPLPPRRPETDGGSGSGNGGGSSFFQNLVRGDFREGADQRVQEAMRRQREESGVGETMARGGAAEKPKKASKDDVLHKALEIIHQLMMRR